MVCSTMQLASLAIALLHSRLWRRCFGPRALRCDDEFGNNGIILLATSGTGSGTTVFVLR